MNRFVDRDEPLSLIAEQAAHIRELEADRKDIMKRLWTSEERAAGLEAETETIRALVALQRERTQQAEAALDAWLGKYNEMRVELANLTRAELAAMEAEKAFWRWLWFTSTQTPNDCDIGATGWMKQMRERFEREARP